jgi:hypothetical protein
MNFKELRKDCPWHEVIPSHKDIENHEQPFHNCNAGALIRYTHGDSCLESRCAIWYFIVKSRK